MSFLSTFVARSVLACMPLVTAVESSTPTWTKPDFFWYRRAVPGGHVWMMVDVQHGVRAPLFDQQRLATELNLKTNGEYTRLTLPFAEPDAAFVVKHDSKASLMPNGMAIEFVRDRRQWRCELELKWSWSKEPPTDYECSILRSVSEDAPAAGTTNGSKPVVAPDGRWEAFVDGQNVAIRPVTGEKGSVRKLSSDGVAGFAYQAGSIRWSSDGKSLTAYRVSDDVWLSDSMVVGSVKDLIVKGLWQVGQP